MDTPPPVHKHPKTFWMYLREGLGRVHRRRPSSFYMLLLFPVVLLLAAEMFDRVTLDKFFLLLSLLFAFLGVVLYRGCMDILDIARQLLREHGESYRETVGDQEFLEKLRSGIETKHPK